jgi:hypothetical protein
MSYSRRGKGDMRVMPDVDRSNGEVKSYKLPPEEIEKIFQDMKPEKIDPKYRINYVRETLDPNWLFDKTLEEEEEMLDIIEQEELDGEAIDDSELPG